MSFLYFLVRWGRLVCLLFVLRALLLLISHASGDSIAERKPSHCRPKPWKLLHRGANDPDSDYYQHFNCHWETDLHGYREVASRRNPGELDDRRISQVYMLTKSILSQVKIRVQNYTDGQCRRSSLGELQDFYQRTRSQSIFSSSRSVPRNIISKRGCLKNKTSDLFRFSWAFNKEECVHLWS